MLHKLLFFFFILFISTNLFSQIIVDHNCTDITAIPESWINQAKSDLHIAYGHTSHGSQLTYGMTNLVSFANNGGKGLNLPTDIFAWNNGGSGGALDLHDSAMSGDCGYYPAWVNNTEGYLDNPDNSDVNVIIWSWCGQVDEKYDDEVLDEEYLTPMNQLEQDYPSVDFVYMTGHVDIWDDANNKAANQMIRDYCLNNDKILYDFADIERYDPDGNYYEYVHDNCDYYEGAGTGHLGNWATEWQSSHTEGEDWYSVYAAHSQDLNGNQKAYAAWWLWAKLAGWPANSTQINLPSGNSSQNFPNQDLAIDFTGVPAQLGLNIAQINETPNISGSLPTEVESLLDQYWSINSSVDNVGTYDITFDLTDIDGIVNFETVKILKRDNCNSAWQDVEDLGASLTYNEPEITVNGLNSFSDFVAAADDQTLPVELSSFEAVRVDNDVSITWTTQAAVNLDGFNIYRNDQPDFDSSQRINTHKIEGINGSSEQNYSYTDNGVNNTSPILYYWLESIDFDLTSEIFGPVYVNMDNFYFDMISHSIDINSYRNISLNWTTANENNDLVGFDIYRSTLSKFAEAEKINSGMIDSNNYDNEFTYIYTDTDLEIGNSYFYWIVGLDWDGIITISKALDIFLPNTILNYVEADLTHNDEIKVNWQTDYELELEGFWVFRKDLENSEEIKLNQNIINAENTLTNSHYSYLDNSAKKGRKYRYSIESLNNNGQKQTYKSNIVNFEYESKITNKYPNPFYFREDNDAAVKIYFELANKGANSISIYNIRGKKVKEYDLSNYGIGENMIK